VAAEVTNDGSDDRAVRSHGRGNQKRTCAPRGVRTHASGPSSLTPGYWSKNNVDTPGVEALIRAGPNPRHQTRCSYASPTSRGALPAVKREEISIHDGRGPSCASGDPASISSCWPANVHYHPPPAVAMGRGSSQHHRAGRRLYKKRSATIEPVFGQTKHNRGMRRFARRGMPAVNSEWKLIAATPQPSSSSGGTPNHANPAFRINPAARPEDLTRTPTSEMLVRTASERAIWRDLSGDRMLRPPCLR